MAEGRKHHVLKQVALRWVQSTGCVAFGCEINWGWIGIVDVVGMKTNGDVYIIEAKASSADMRADTKRGKLYRLENSTRIDFVYYCVADGVKTDHLPGFIGVLDEHGRVRRKAKRRSRPHNIETRLDNFSRMARALSWRAYGRVINGEQEQQEFSLIELDSP